eukprot:g66279.t1
MAEQGPPSGSRPRQIIPCDTTPALAVHYDLSTRGFTAAQLPRRNTLYLYARPPDAKLEDSADYPHLDPLDQVLRSARGRLQVVIVATGTAEAGPLAEQAAKRLWIFVKLLMCRRNAKGFPLGAYELLSSLITRLCHSSQGHSSPGHSSPATSSASFAIAHVSQPLKDCSRGGSSSLESWLEKTLWWELASDFKGIEVKSLDAQRLFDATRVLWWWGRQKLDEGYVAHTLSRVRRQGKRGLAPVDVSLEVHEPDATGPRNRDKWEIYYKTLLENVRAFKPARRFQVRSIRQYPYADSLEADGCLIEGAVDVSYPRQSACSRLCLRLWNMKELKIRWGTPLTVPRARTVEISVPYHLEKVILLPDATLPVTDQELRLTLDCQRDGPEEGESPPITDAKRGLMVIHGGYQNGPLPHVVITLRSTNAHGDEPLFLQLEKFRAKSVCLQGTDSDLAEAAQVRNFRRVRLRLVDMQGVTIIKARHLRLDPADLAAGDAMKLGRNSPHCVIECVGTPPPWCLASERENGSTGVSKPDLKKARTLHKLGPGSGEAPPLLSGPAGSRKLFLPGGRPSLCCRPENSGRPPLLRRAARS